MVKNYTICNIEIVDKKTKLLVDEIMEMCSELSPRKVVSLLKDEKGNYKFLKGTRTTIKGDFLVDMNTYDEDVVLDRYVQHLCKNCKIVCRVDFDNERLKALYEKCYNEIRELIAGVSAPSIEEEKEEETPVTEPVNLSSLLNPSTTFGGISSRKNKEELKLNELALELENKVNDITSFINENKLKIDKKQIEDISNRLIYSSDLIKSILRGLKY